MGVLGWRKGSDVFLQVAKKVISERSDIQFIWCGGHPKSAEWLAMLHDIKNMGLEEAVRLIPSTGEALQVMACFDVFFLSSREDPYPLVVLEAGMMEMPLVCFEKSGGATEFVGPDCGHLVSYLDIRSAADALLKLRSDKDSYKVYSNNARRKYLAMHTEDRVFEQFEELLRQHKSLKAMN
jgi:glycosyltransferase involved in cell wall biosynthesis